MARKILLADDSVTAQNMGRKILTDAGYEVITVNNGSAALKRVGEQKPDLIVLDVYMPGYSGLEVCQRLKDSPDTARIPILLTVGKLEPFKPEEARRVNADAFIVKPFEASELLSALTRLEDRMVPHADGARFNSTSISGIERFSGDSGFGAGRKGDAPTDDTDTGWKNRIRFPSKKKVEEPEPEPQPEDFTTASPRDSRRSSSKSRVAASSPSAAAAQEPGLVPDIPRDITPDELDALSALAAKLDGPIPEHEDIVPVGGKLGPAEDASAPVETSAVSAGAKSDVTLAPSPVFEVKPLEVKPQEDAPIAHAAALEAPPAVVSEPVPAAAAEPMPETPVIAPAPESAAEEIPPASSIVPEEPVASASPGMTQQSPLEVATPVSQQYEPPPVAETRNFPVESAAAPADLKAEDKIDQPFQAEAPQTPEPVSPEAAPAAEAAMAEAERVPTEEELAEALRLLTPSQPQTEAPPPVHPEEPVTVPDDVVRALEQVGQSAGYVGRWVAESVTLSPEESAISLEAEMFQKFSMSSVSESAKKASEESAEPAATAAITPESIAAEAPSIVQSSASELPTAAPVPPDTIAAQAPEPTPVEDFTPPAATFADAMQKAPEREPESTIAPPPVERREPESSATVPAEPELSAESQHEPTSEDEVGGQEMGRDKSKAGWSSFHAIKPGTAPVAGNDPVQAAKDAEAQAVQTKAAEEAPKAMAAAAGAESSTSDSSAIASIVDSVLADLRPKIVEEIAKKLGKK